MIEITYYVYSYGYRYLLLVSKQFISFDRSHTPQYFGHKYERFTDLNYSVSPSTIIAHTNYNITTISVVLYTVR